MYFPFPRSLSRNNKYSSMNHGETHLLGVSFAIKHKAARVKLWGALLRCQRVESMPDISLWAGRREEVGRLWAHVWPWTQLYQPQLPLRGSAATPTPPVGLERREAGQESAFGRPGWARPDISWTLSEEDGRFSSPWAAHGSSRCAWFWCWKLF